LLTRAEHDSIKQQQGITSCFCTSGAGAAVSDAVNCCLSRLTKADSGGTSQRLLVQLSTAGMANENDINITLTFQR
jgi:hypothetical protein